MSGVTKKVQFPKALLSMKFMEKTNRRLKQEFENTLDHDILYSSLITNEMRNATDNYRSESSFLFCVDLVEGRLSYKGMNPEVEQLMEPQNHNEDIKTEIQKDVSDEYLLDKFPSANKKKKK